MQDFRDDIKGTIDEDAILFFGLFSRIEFALKRGGFLSGEVGKNAEPHWDKFAAALGPDVYRALEKAPEASIFFKQPPKRLIVIGVDDVKFEETAAIKNLQMLFVAIRGARNNLFHGEKVYISQRDRDLMEAASFVLSFALNACAGIEECKRVPSCFVFAQIPGYP